MKLTNGESIVLVGNGPSATRAPVGSIIDRFDIVVRFNHFVTAGYELWIGEKTDIWVINGPGYDVRFPCARLPHIVYAAPLPLEEADLSCIATLKKSHPSFTVFDESIVGEAKRLFKTEVDATGKECARYPSTGALAALFFLGSFSVVHIHGFDFMQGPLHHYYESATRAELLDWHDPGAEQAFFLENILAGRVQRLNSSHSASE